MADLVRDASRSSRGSRASLATAQPRPSPSTTRCMARSRPAVRVATAARDFRVLIPTTRPASSKSGPPELPGLMAALTCTKGRPSAGHRRQQTPDHALRQGRRRSGPPYRPSRPRRRESPPRPPDRVARRVARVAKRASGRRMGLASSQHRQVLASSRPLHLRRDHLPCIGIQQDPHLSALLGAGDHMPIGHQMGTASQGKARAGQWVTHALAGRVPAPRRH